VAVEVQFTGQSQSTAPTRTATLQIQGDIWNPISIPLTALTGQISIQLPAIISIIQRGSLSVPFNVTSVAGPPTTVSVSTAPVSLLPPGISLSATLSSTQVSKGQPASGILRISAAIQATPGTYQLGISSSAFNGTLTNTFSFSLNVVVLTLNPSSPIAARYLSLGGPQGKLGAIKSDEAFCSDLVGQFQSYQNGAIFWSGVEGAAAFAVFSGPILSHWLQIGPYPPQPGDVVSTLNEAPQMSLGYPTSDLFDVPVLGIWKIGEACHFQHGGIYLKSTTGVHTVLGPFFDLYATLGEATGVLGFPISDDGDYENGVLFLKPGNASAQQLLVSDPFAVKSQFVLDQVNALVRSSVSQYNLKALQTGDYRLDIQGGARFQNPMLTDYSQVEGVTRGRMYQIAQDFFVLNPFFILPDITITLAFQLGLMNDGDGIFAFILNPVVDIQGHGTPIPDRTLQKTHDTIIAFASQANRVIPLPIPGLTLVSVKVLTSGAGVGLSAAKFQALGGPGALALLIQP
jgi:hypothetical protein